VVGTSLKSDNASSAENQQERLVRTGWITGFVDGEGCFSIGLIRQQSRPSRKGYRTGYQVFPEFVVTQGSKSLAALEELRDFFGVGQVLINRRQDNHKEHLHRYVVRGLNDLRSVVIPFFREFTLRTAKRDDFQSFAQCVEIISTGRHLRTDGLADLLEIMQTMNSQKSRSELIRILRDHTPET
jgi:LAGLIDADG endonuclease